MRARLGLAPLGLQSTELQNNMAPGLLQKPNGGCVDRYGVNPALIWVHQPKRSICKTFRANINQNEFCQLYFSLVLKHLLIFINYHETHANIFFNLLNCLIS